MSDFWSDELISAYLDDQLSASERQRVEEHLQSNPADAASLRQLKKVRASLQRAPRYSLSDHFSTRIVQEIESRLEPAPAPTSPAAGSAKSTVALPSGWKSAAAAMAALAALVLIAIMMVPRQHSPSSTAKLTEAESAVESSAGADQAPTEEQPSGAPGTGEPKNSDSGESDSEDSFRSAEGANAPPSARQPVERSKGAEHPSTDRLESQQKSESEPIEDTIDEPIRQNLRMQPSDNRQRETDSKQPSPPAGSEPLKAPDESVNEEESRSAGLVEEKAESDANRPEQNRSPADARMGRRGKRADSDAERERSAPESQRDQSRAGAIDDYGFSHQYDEVLLVTTTLTKQRKDLLETLEATTAPQSNDDTESQDMNRGRGETFHFKKDDFANKLKGQRSRSAKEKQPSSGEDQASAESHPEQPRDFSVFSSENSTSVRMFTVEATREELQQLLEHFGGDVAFMATGQSFMLEPEKQKLQMVQPPGTGGRGGFGGGGGEVADPSTAVAQEEGEPIRRQPRLQRMVPQPSVAPESSSEGKTPKVQDTPQPELDDEAATGRSDDSTESSGQAGQESGQQTPSDDPRRRYLVIIQVVPQEAPTAPEAEPVDEGDQR